MFKVYSRKVFTVGLIVLSLMLFVNLKVIALDVNPVTCYFWTNNMQEESINYGEMLRQSRDKGIAEVLQIDDTNIYLYTDDMNVLYDLAKDKGKVAEVEEIMGDYQKKYASYEIYLLTGDKELSNSFYDDDSIDFKFERVI